MKAVGRQVGVSAETPNGDTKRRPSYPGELRAKHANMSAKIWVKVAMAIAYFFSVSVAAFILAIYYAFFWKPNSPSGNSSLALNGTVAPNISLALDQALNGTQAPNRTECVSSG